MKKILYWILILFAFSCKDEGQAQEILPPSFKIAVTLSSTQQYWIVFSDASGKVLAWASLTNGATFNYPFEGEENSLNLTLISKSSPSSSFTSIYTFSEIVPGSYEVNDRTFTSHPVKGTFTLVADATLFSGSNVQTDNPCERTESYNGKEKRFDFKLCGDMNHLYAWAPNGTKAPRYFFTDMVPGASAVFDRSLLEQLPEMKGKSIALSQMANGDLTVFGNLDKGGKLEVYHNYFLSGNSMIPLYYPETGSLFSSFDYVFRYQKESDISFGFIGKGLSEPVEKFEELLVDLDKTSLVNTTSKLSYKITGQAKYIRSVLFQYDQMNPGVSWVVIHPFKSTIEMNLPQFSDNLLKETDLNFLKTLHFTGVSFEDDYDLTDYSSLFKGNADLKLDEGGPKKKNGRNKTYFFPLN